VAHLYDNYTGDFVCHWGGGMTYQKTIRTADRNDEYDNTVISDIMNHTYDIVIYGSYHRGLPFIDIVSSFYKDNEIVLLCGEDCDIDKNRTYHDCPLKKYSETDINIFIREQ
jgi:hypothetical protein